MPTFNPNSNYLPNQFRKPQIPVMYTGLDQYPSSQSKYGA